MSDTPRTDALENRFFEQRTYVDEIFVHARQLERELAEAKAQRDKAIAFLHVHRNDTPLGNQPHMLAHEVDQFLKECGK